MEHKLRNGEIIHQQSRQDRMLKLLYGNCAGRFFLKILTRPFISKIAGKFLSTKFSCRFIKSFIKNNNIDMSLYEDTQYKSYNDFFCRRIKPQSRPIDAFPESLISPCDSKLLALEIDNETVFSIKNTQYTVASLLKDETLASQYRGGYILIFRLSVDDYHRYCYVDNGEKEENVTIPGRFHTVMPIANDYFPIYKENTREYSILHSENFGKVIMMEVGALLVGKIVNLHQKASVVKGQEKGYFEFGGSTVVLIFEPDTIKIDDDILANSSENYETVVKFGEKIGNKKH